MSAPLANTNPLLKLTSSSTPGVSKRTLTTEGSERNFQQVLQETRHADDHRPAVKKATKAEHSAKAAASKKEVAPKKEADELDAPAADKQERTSDIKKSARSTTPADDKIAEKKSDKKINKSDGEADIVATDQQPSVVPSTDAKSSEESVSTVLDLLLQEKGEGAPLGDKAADSGLDMDKANDLLALASSSDPSLIAQTLTQMVQGQPTPTDASDATEDTVQPSSVLRDNVKNNQATVQLDLNAEGSESDLDLSPVFVTASDYSGDVATADKPMLGVKPTETSAAPVADLKNTFEKMLQTVALSTEKSADVSQGASVAAPSPISTSQVNPGLESLARLTDAQSPAARSFVVQTAIPVNVGQPQWSQAVGEKVLWLAAQNVSSAEIRLDPPELGPMQVKVSVNQDQTSVSFTSHHPMVREVLDQNLHRLRDMFSEQGLNLSNVDVSDKSFSRQQQEGKNQQGSAHQDPLIDEETPVATSAIIHQRLVDHYA